ncbi:hypothetical protein PPERSA_08273 [Pseudocohnilembus persalinus]|uniref:DNA polymerase alpha/epsilon, subunit B n=1 Tax=Pseudocohnilembus persalinus TaxID=266149 RepID=A0A0V0QG44_PSEPJ|nr:hypothetical protein PPERSA_08273 [Pseudocohnilembus persalinus]|eukprot:KRX01172.1 hypothetical protein PPERSA_08273 [Pseudocohnilembus persalinus]
MEIEVQKASKQNIKNIIFKFQEKEKVQVKQRKTNINEKVYHTFSLPKKKAFHVQYSHIYFLRQEQLGLILRERFLEDKQKFIAPNIVSIEPGQNVIAIGTLSKIMKLKPQFVEQYDSVQQKGINYCDPSDYLYLEDSSGKIKLEFDQNSFYYDLQNNQQLVNEQNLLTGIVCALVGQQNEESGKFLVYQMIFKGLNDQNNDKFQIERPIFKNKNNNFKTIDQYINPQSEDQFVAFVSGINFCETNQFFPFLMLKNFLFGNDLNPKLTEFSKRIQKLVITGNLIKEPENLEEVTEGAYKIDEEYTKLYQHISNTMNYLDSQLAELLEYIPIDIMPGPNDPSNQLYPQQQLNKCYFPKSYKYAGLNSLSNPCHIECNDVQMIGTGGQNIQDLKQYSNLGRDGDDLQIIENNILWGHLAPTAPDSLNCYPFTKEKDVFVLEQIPHVYFVGNCQKFGTKIIYDEKSERFCRIIAIPQFSQSQSIVLLNLKNLDTFQFNINEINI